MAGFGSIGIGAMIGALASLRTGFGVSFKDRSDRPRRLRVALLQEIEAMDEPLQKFGLVAEQRKALPEVNFLIASVVGGKGNPRRPMEPCQPIVNP